MLTGSCFCPSFLPRVSSSRLLIPGATAPLDSVYTLKDVCIGNLGTGVWVLKVFCSLHCKESLPKLRMSVEVLDCELSFPHPSSWWWWPPQFLPPQGVCGRAPDPCSLMSCRKCPGRSHVHWHNIHMEIGGQYLSLFSLSTVLRRVSLLSCFCYCVP